MNKEKKEIEEIVNKYGNSIARITMDFITDDSSEAERDRKYKDAGNDFMTELDSYANKKLDEMREKVENLPPATRSEWESGDEKLICEFDVLSILSNK